MNINMKTTISIIAVLLLIVGCTSKKHEDGVINEETVLNSTTGEVDMQHTEGYITTDTTGIQLWYDIFGDTDNPRSYLFMGLTPRQFPGCLISMNRW